MAAELDYRADGSANMVYAGETPWHREGVRITGDEMYDFDGIMKNHFFYSMTKKPYFYPEYTVLENGERRITNYKAADDAFYVERSDTGANLGRVGNQYKIIQNAEAFELLKPLVDERVAAIETGGVLRAGADAWLMVKWDLTKFNDETRKIMEQDGGIQPYSTVCANHNGRRPVLLGNTPIRIVCANTLGMAETDSRKNANRWERVRHNRFAGQRLVDAAEVLFKGVIQQYDKIAKFYKLLMETKLDEEWFNKLVLDVVVPDDVDPKSKHAGAMKERIDVKRIRLSNLWTTGKGHTGEKTAWYAYNAVTQALDHDSELWRTRGGSKRTAAMLDGNLFDLKNAVLDGLAKYAMNLAI